ncbi:CHAT domain-containing protein [Actinomadura madurae]|uniref:CHAT domain-containing protein n=1 Tax=Actinomadura madurae TaxID=1993 RepID=A0A1I5F1B0_9ACTN|nr:CHAT domain-containing protein [Actinomadura madurae]SFO17473.1 CHAT domain-containing protein [Actinomadura madurae]
MTANVSRTLSSPLPELRLDIEDHRPGIGWRWRLTGTADDTPVFHDVDLTTRPTAYEGLSDPAAYLRRYGSRLMTARRSSSDADLVTGLAQWGGKEIFGRLGPLLAAYAPVVVHVTVPDGPPDPEHPAHLPLQLAHVGGVPLALQGVVFVPSPGAGPGPPDPESAGDRPRMLAVFSRPEGTSALNLRGERLALERGSRDPSGWRGTVDLRFLPYGVTAEKLGRVLDAPAGWDVIHISAHGRPGRLRLETEAGLADDIDTTTLAHLLEPVRESLKLLVMSACWSSVLAAELAERLDCAVVAMRYAVGDDFSAALTGELYGRLFGDRMTLGRAMGEAMRAVAGEPGPDPLWVAAPALFGPRAARLRFALPPSPPAQAPAVRSMRSTAVSDLPPPHEHLFGRDNLLSRAGAALTGVALSGVVLYGMPGVGKSACAVELAHFHSAEFDKIFWLTANDPDVLSRLTRISADLETSSREAVLVVVDGAEALLSPDGDWRDPRWGRLLADLTARPGGRLLITTRVRQRGPDIPLATEVVGLLPTDEAALLARAHGLDRTALPLTYGHPALLALAADRVADSDRPDRPLTSLKDGRGAAVADMASWTRAVLMSLDSTERELYYMLCDLKDDARRHSTAEAAWERLWDVLDLAGRVPPAPDFDGLLAGLRDSALVTVVTGPEPRRSRLLVHPVMAAVGREEADAHEEPHFRSAINAALLGLWSPDSGHVDNGDQVQWRLHKAHSLLELGFWSEAARYLEEVLHNDHGQQSAHLVLKAIDPVLQAASQTAVGPRIRRAVAMAANRLDPSTGRAIHETHLAEALASRDHKGVILTSGDLLPLLLDAGELARALRLTEEAIGHGLMGGLGPWQSVAARAQRLRVFERFGSGTYVQRECERLLAEVARLPEPDEDDDSGVIPGNLRESLLTMLFNTAMRRGDYAGALETNDAIVKSKAERGVSQGDLSRTWFERVAPLMRLDRLDEAAAVLDECGAVFAAVGDLDRQGDLHQMRAALEFRKGNLDMAVRQARDALRHAYASGLIEDLPIRHYNLGKYLGEWGEEPELALVHQLASGLIHETLGETDDSAIRAAGTSLHLYPSISPPASAEALRDLLDDGFGDDLARLIEEVAPGVWPPNRTLAHLVERSRDHARSRADREAVTRAADLAYWDPTIAALAASVRGDPDARAVVDRELDRSREDPAWHDLTSAFRDLLGRAQRSGRWLRRPRPRALSEAEVDDLVSGLDTTGKAVLVRAVEVLTGRRSLPPALIGAVGAGGVLRATVEGALGNTDAENEVRKWLRECIGEEPDFIPSATVLELILDGNRDPEIATRLDDVDQAIVTCVLDHITVLERWRAAPNQTG